MIPKHSEIHDLKGSKSVDVENLNSYQGYSKCWRFILEGQFFLSKLILGNDAMKTPLDILEPVKVDDQAREIAGTIVLDKVERDLQEISKTLVGVMLTSKGKSY